jgi:hypothetical protein
MQFIAEGRGSTWWGRRGGGGGGGGVHAPPAYNHSMARELSITRAPVVACGKVVLGAGQCPLNCYLQVNLMGIGGGCQIVFQLAGLECGALVHLQVWW